MKSLLVTNSLKELLELAKKEDDITTQIMLKIYQIVICI